MSADPKQVIRITRLRGIDLWLEDDGRLKGRHRSGQMPDDMRQFIAHFKPLIIAELERQEEQAAHRSDIAATAANILQLTDAEREQLRQEIAATPANDPNLTFDREAFHRAMQIIKDREELEQEEKEIDHVAA